MENRKRLFLLDAYALIFRAYYAFINRPVTDKQGNNTSAIFGFVNTLDELLRNENPSHIAVAFDPPSPTFRHKMYPEYKANRQSTPEDIRFAVPWIKEIISAYKIQIIEKEGFEADDVIGTLAKRAAENGFDVYMMTPDKDYGQLVSEHVFMYKPGRSGGEKEILGIEEIKEKFEVSSPIQIIDLLALWGDSSDNVPGAPGIGEKTAKKLIAEYGSIDNLLKSASELKGKLRESLENNREQILLSKELVTIDLNVPLEVDFDQMIVKDPDHKKLLELFERFDFRTFSKRLSAKETKPNQPFQTSLFGESLPETRPSEIVSSNEKFQAEKVEYVLVDTDEKVQKLVSELLKCGAVCIDTETTGLNYFSDRLIGIAISYQSAKAYYLVSDSDEQMRRWVGMLNTFLSKTEIVKVGHNLKFDIHFLARYGADIKGEVFDTMVAHYLLKPEGRHKLDDVIRDEFNYEMIPIEELIGKKGKDQRTMEGVDLQLVTNYACEDADYTFRLYTKQQKQLSDKMLMELAIRIEMPLVSVLFHMEHSGFKIDNETLNKYNEQLLEEIEQTKKLAFEAAGEEFNLSSPRQLGVILFEKLSISSQNKLTKTKQYSTSEEVLQTLTDKHPIVPLILEYRGLSKLQSTYVSALPLLIEPSTQKVHTSFNQTITATGRLSSVNPNLQNIPIREERGREIRKSFIASDKEHVILAADYSQIELRLMAHLSQDPQMIEAFKQGADIHRSTASKIFKVTEEEVTREMRSQAKTANFGIIYGISAFGLAERLKISRSDAKQLIDSYFESFPKVKHYMDSCITSAREQGYVVTMFGRKRYLPDIQSANATVRGFAERNAINSPIQGSAADVIKIAMVAIQEKLLSNRLKSNMILQVHDELVFDVFLPELETMKELVRYEMESAAKLSVPLTVDMGIGNNWLEAH